MRFMIILLSVFSLLFYYLGTSLFSPLDSVTLQAAGWITMAILFAAILWVPLVHWKSDAEETTDLQRGLLWLAFGAMGLLSFVFVLSLLRTLAQLLLGTEALKTAEASGAVLTLSAILFGAGYLRARFGVKLWRVDVPLKALPIELDGLKIVQITDLHVGPTIRRQDVEKVVALANSASPDLIVLTGDLVDGTVRDLHEEVAPLSKLNARMGVFYVPGNHEYYWEARPWIEHFAGMGMIPLTNAHRVLNDSAAKLLIAGITDPAAQQAQMPGPDFELALQNAPLEVQPKILLCHQPKFYPEAARHGFDLQLSGHTHGGQFFPWTLVAGWVHRFNYGLHQHGALSVYVSRGTGYWGPPVRLGSPAEVTLLTLRRSVV